MTQPVWAAAPTRTFSYITGEVIESSKVTTNEDNIFTYLQAGVDTYAADSITAAAIAAGAVGASEISDNSITATDLAADSVGSSELIESEDYTLQNLILSGTGPDVRWNPTTGDSFHLGAEYSANSGSTLFLSNVTDGQHYLRVRNDHLFEFPQYLSCNAGLTTGADGRVSCNTSAWPVALGGTGLTAVPTNGQLYIGDGVGSPTLATLTAGTNITITNGAGSITVAATGGGDVGGTNALRAQITGDFTTTSTTFVDITDVRVTITPSASNPVAVGFTPAGCQNTTIGDGVALAVEVDGARVYEELAVVQTGSVSSNMSCTIAYMTAALAASAQIIDIQARAITGGTATVGGPKIVWAFEAVD